MRAGITQPPLGTPLLRNHPLSQGLVGCWLGNEGGGQKLFDSVGGRNVGALTNGAKYQQTQKGNSVFCDGTNDYIGFTTISSALNLTSSCSFSYWLNIAAQPAEGVWFRVIDHYGGSIAPSSPYGYYMGYYKSGGVLTLALYYGTGGSSASLFFAYTLSLNTWYHIVQIHNNSLDTDYCYVNGVLAGSGTGKTENPANKSTSPLYFMSEDGGNKCTNGLIQDIKIYNRPLNRAEVLQLYTSPYCMFQSKSNRIYYVGGVAFTQSLSDSNTLTDSILLNFGKKPSDSITLSDAIAKASFLSKADSITLSDAIIKSFGLNKSDASSLTDAISKGFATNAADSVSLADAIAKASGLNPTDTITLSDAALRALGLNPSDTLTVADVISKAIGLNQTDSATLSDILSNGFARSFADAATLTDTISKSVTLNKSDAVSLTDALLKSIGVNIVDTVTLTAFLSTLRNLLLSLSDSITLSDNALRSVIYLRTATDVMSLTDALVKNFGIHKSDSATLADAISKQIALSATDSITLSDLIDILFYFGILKRWDGAEWIAAPLATYTGSLFAAKPLRYWNGTAWKQINING